VSFDDQVRAAVDRALAQLRGHLEDDLGAFTQDLARVFADERTRAAADAAEAAAAEVRRQAEAHVAQLREATQRQTEELRRVAEAQVADIGRSLQGQLEEVRKAAQNQIEEARRVAHSEIADARQTAASQVDDVQRTMTARLEETRRDLEEQLEETRRRARLELDAARLELDTARAEVENARRAAQVEAEEVLIAQLAAAQRDADKRENEAIDRTRTDALQADLAHAARLLDAVRTLDAARSLADVLDTLAESAGHEVDRAVVLVVKGERLRGWKWTGFAPETSARTIDLDFDAAGIAGAVVRTGAAVSRPEGEAAGNLPLPAFAQAPGGRRAMALPVLVGGQVVAVLYADAPRSDTPSAGSRWPAILEVLARHASRALEAVTVEQATGLSLPRPMARPWHGAMPGPVEHGGSGDEDAARRYARLLVSEIRMYYEPLVDAGRRSRDLLSRLSGEIDRARRLYEARVPPAVRDKADFFEQELVRTLANGDRSLLGHAT
jgi:hypothetical protein